MSQPTIRICLIGQKFMGRAHSNAYLKVDKFFNLAAKPVMLYRVRAKRRRTGNFQKPLGLAVCQHQLEICNLKS